MGHGPAVRPGGGHCVPSRHTRGWANKGATSFSLMTIGMGVSLFHYPYLHSIYLLNTISTTGIESPTIFAPRFTLEPLRSQASNPACYRSDPAGEKHPGELPLIAAHR
jgi:hypothetical protein